MPTPFNNYLLPTSVKPQQFGGNEVMYFVKTFEDMNIADLDTAVNAFLVSLANAGNGWPHIVQTHFTTSANKAYLSVTYLTVGAP
jgi:hypothetical protein